MEQLVWQNEDYQVIADYLQENKLEKVLLVCGKSYDKLEISRFFGGLEEAGKIKLFRFSDYQANPDYESVVLGIQEFKKNECDAIIAVGGGSGMDVAKCIKVFCNLNPEINYLEQAIGACDVPLLVVPTTAGTGSEATRYAVIYYQGEKQSVTHQYCIPNAVFFDASTLVALPDYVKKSALLDALCHGIESYWSVNSTEESKQLAAQSIRMIKENYEQYIAGNTEVNAVVLQAANIAGKAINITQTTAAHAMAYKLTKKYGISHGQAVALCLTKLWRYMEQHMDQCKDSRGSEYVSQAFIHIAKALGFETVAEAILYLEQMLEEWDLGIKIKKEDLDELVRSVNVVRLANNPIALSEQDIREIYLKLC